MSFLKITPKGDSTIVGSPQIDLFIIASDDSTEMKISLDPEFSGATWQPFNAEVNCFINQPITNLKWILIPKATINIRSPLAYGWKVRLSLEINEQTVL